MKRSEINSVITEATDAFKRHGWVMPPNPHWDVTDFGLHNFSKYGLVLVNLAEQPEYCEKIMYVRHNQITPYHCHKEKKEDIICRWGVLEISLRPEDAGSRLQVNGEWRDIAAGESVILQAGERVTLTSGIRHSFWAHSDYAVVGEVSTANNDTDDNFFDDSDVGRFGEIEEDVPAIVTLVSEE